MNSIRAWKSARLPLVALAAAAGIAIGIGADRVALAVYIVEKGKPLAEPVP